MAAPDLTKRYFVAVQKNGTDDPGANAVGAPQSRLTIRAALADLAANYPAADGITTFHVVSVGVGTFDLSDPLPPNTTINGSCDGENQPTTQLQLTADMTLATAWNANAPCMGQISNVTLRAKTGTPALDLTMPGPLSGNPVRTVTLYNVRHNLTREKFQGTSTADTLIRIGCIQDGLNTDLFSQISGLSVLQNCQSAAQLQITDAAGLPAVGQWSGVKMTAAGAFLLAQSTVAAGCTLALSACSLAGLHFNATGAGVLAVTADTPSVPVRANVSFAGSATIANLTYANDAQGVGYSPTTPGNWSPVPVNVQQALDGVATALAPGGNFIPYANDGFIVVKTVGNAVTNGNNLIAAYAAAVALTPNGAALSATNRACVIIPPAKYDLGTQQLILATQFVDLSGWSSNAADAAITSTRNSASQGTINQTANDVQISNVSLSATGSFALGILATDPAAYFPASGLTLTILNNVIFSGANWPGGSGAWGCRILINYAGRYLNCTGGDLCLGGIGGFGSTGTLLFSGYAQNCTFNLFSLGGLGTCTGTLINCACPGGGSYGANFSGFAQGCTGGVECFATNGTFSGVAINCTCGSASFGQGSVFSGTCINCTSTADGSFGDGSTSFSGVCINCKSANTSFGAGATFSGSPVLMGCICTIGTFNTSSPLLRIINCIDANGARINFPNPFEATAAGTPYSLTNTPAALVFGTTSPAITITQPGNYLLFGVVVVQFNAATFAANRTVALKLRRTNNTAADVANGSVAIITGIVTGLIGPLGVIVIPPTTYSTVLATDTLTIFGSLDVAPTAGSLDCVAPGTKLLAQRL